MATSSASAPPAKRWGVQVKVIAVGTGAALAMAGRGDADAVLVHAPRSEKKYVESGDLVAGRLVMHNDFVLVGPPDDPAGVRGAPELGAALRAIAERGIFVSRGDDSGTHSMELELWREAGIDPKALELYKAALERHGDRAVAPVQGSVCQGCLITVRPQQLSLLRARDQIVTCWECGRVLYLEGAA